MPAKSEKQRRAFAAALAVKRGKAKAKKGSTSAKLAKSMSAKQLKHFTKRRKRR